MALSKLTLHIIILYVLVLILGGILFFTQEDHEWVCVQEVCLESAPAGDAWAQENCGEIETQEGERIVACALVIDGVEQLVPLTSLNLSAIQTCTLYQCLQEVPVRATDYTFEP